MTLKIPRSIKPASTVQLFGVGSSGNKFVFDNDTPNGIGLWLQSNHSSGTDARAIYARLYFNGAGSGEVLRAYATVATTNVATGGTVNGAHISLIVNASSSVSGQGNALRATLEAAAATRTISGNLAVITAESNIGANNTVPSTVAFLRLVNLGSVKIGHFLRVPAAANSTVFATHTTDTFSHSIRIIDDAGTPYAIMVTDTFTNRGGGS